MKKVAVIKKGKTIMCTPCEDFPCCGHGYDRNGNPDCPDSQGRFTCVGCGKRLSRKASSSICSKCQRRMRDDESFMGGDFDYSMNY